MANLWKNNLQGVGKLLLDPLSFGSSVDNEDFNRALSKEQLQLQREQFDYQKWYDKNNVKLQAEQNADLGINLMAMNGAGTSSVSASGSPQPVAGQMPNTAILGDFLSQLGENHRADMAADLEQQRINNDKQYKDDVVKVLKDRAKNDAARTDTYGDKTKQDVAESQARQNQILNDLEKAVEGNYGRNSSTVKKLIGELKDTLNRRIDSVNEWLDERYDDKPSKPSKPSKSSAGEKHASSESTSDDWDAYLKAKSNASKSGYYLTYDDWKKTKRR